MSTEQPTGLARRERRGSEKQAIGIENIQRMLPLVIKTMPEGEPSPRDRALMGFAPDMMPMMLEDAYCDMWGRTDVIDSRLRSLFSRTETRFSVVRSGLMRAVVMPDGRLQVRQTEDPYRVID
jgi:hypothetical protein